MSDATLDPTAVPAPVPITSRALIREALNLAKAVWNRRPAIWPIAVVIVFAEGAVQESGALGLQHRFLFEIASFLVSAALSAICIRAILDHGRGPWTLDRNLWRFIGVRFVLDVPALVGAILLDLKLGVAALLPLAASLLIYAIVALRFIPWPIGALIGNQKMTAGESWRLTRGGMLIIIGSFLQVALVFIGVSLVAVMLAFLVTLSIHSDIKHFVQIWRPVVAGAAFPIYISLEAAIYKLAVERSDLPARSAA